MLITKSQGAACRRAAEMIVKGSSAYQWTTATLSGTALLSIGWGCDKGNDDTWFDCIEEGFDQSQVIQALLWCAEIAGEV